MAGMGLGSFLSGASQGMEAGMRMKAARKGTDQGGDGQAGTAIQAAAQNQALGFGGEDYTPGQKLLDSETERARQIEQQRQDSINNMNQQNMSGGQSQQQGGMGIDPSTAMSMYSQFGGGSSAGGSAAGAGGGTAGGAGGAGSGAGSSSGVGSWFSGLFGGGGAGGGAGGAGAAGGGGAAAGGGGSAAGGGASSGIAAAGPWAALAAAIVVNEKSARNGGHRRDGWQYGKDLIGGKVLEQDANSRWQQKLGGYNDDKTGLLNDAGAGAEFTTFDFSNGFKKLKNGGTPGKILGGIKKLF